jgi:uncharacterized protein (DUF983 family)
MRRWVALTGNAARGTFSGMTVIKTSALVTSAHESSARDATELTVGHSHETRDVWTSFKRGWGQTCPHCAKGAMYKSYLKVNDACPSCGEELHHQRADDAPPYFTILIVAHVIGAFILVLEQNYPLNAWVEGGISMAIVIGLSLWLLPRIKGALIAYQWANHMHGFGEGAFEGADLAPADPLPAAAP